MVGIEDHRAFLDRIARICPVRADHAETEIIPTTETRTDREEPRTFRHDVQYLGFWVEISPCPRASVVIGLDRTEQQTRAGSWTRALGRGLGVVPAVTRGAGHRL